MHYHTIKFIAQYCKQNWLLKMMESITSHFKVHLICSVLYEAMNCNCNETFAKKRIELN